MPETQVVFFRSESGKVPVLDALERIAMRKDVRLAAKCRAKIERLAMLGHELRRPDADYLDEGIHELRVIHRRRHLRVLYFFDGGIAVLSHIIRKEGRVPLKEIHRAVGNRVLYRHHPLNHTFEL